jgi:hypothetical protein
VIRDAPLRVAVGLRSPEGDWSRLAGGFGGRDARELSLASLGTTIAPQAAGRVPVDSVPFDFQRVLSGFVVVGVEIALVALVCAALYAVTSAVISRAATMRGGEPATWSAAKASFSRSRRATRPAGWRIGASP